MSGVEKAKIVIERLETGEPMKTTKEGIAALLLAFAEDFCCGICQTKSEKLYNLVIPFNIS